MRLISSSARIGPQSPRAPGPRIHKSAIRHVSTQLRGVDSIVYARPAEDAGRANRILRSTPSTRGAPVHVPQPRCFNDSMPLMSGAEAFSPQGPLSPCRSRDRPSPWSTPSLAVLTTVLACLPCPAGIHRSYYRPQWAGPLEPHARRRGGPPEELETPRPHRGRQRHSRRGVDRRRLSRRACLGPGRRRRRRVHHPPVDPAGGRPACGRPRRRLARPAAALSTAAGSTAGCPEFTTRTMGQGPGPGLQCSVARVSPSTRMRLPAAPT